MTLIAWRQPGRNAAASPPPAALLRWGPSGPSGGPTPAPDLVAAVLARLRSDAGVVAAFGDGPSSPRFWAGDVLGSPGLPWLRVERPLSRRRFFSGGTFVEQGQLQVSLFAAGSTRAQALSDLIAKGEPDDPPGALDDPPLVFRGGRLMKFRLSPSSAGWAGGPGVGTPASYQRVLMFDYEFSGGIS